VVRHKMFYQHKYKHVLQEKLWPTTLHTKITGTGGAVTGTGGAVPALVAQCVKGLLPR
jgi:hypothetical protein